MRRLFVAGICVLVLGIFSMAHAEDIAGRFGLGIGAGIMTPKDLDDADIDSEFFPSINFTYGITSNFALELSLGRAEFDLKEKSEWGGSWGKLTTYPVLLTAQYRIPTGSGFQPYLGAGIGYYFNEFDTSSELVTQWRVETGNANDTIDIEFDDSFGYHVNLGMDYFLSKNVALNLDARYAWVKVEGTVKGTVNGTPFTLEGDDKESINPYSIGVGIKYFF